MNECGFLSPEAVLYECASYDHLSTAIKICEGLGKVCYNGIEAEDYLMDLGWVVVRARDVYGRIGYPRLDNGQKIVRLTDVQKAWLVGHYEDMPTDKQRSVDRMIDYSDSVNRRYLTEKGLI